MLEHKRNSSRNYFAQEENLEVATILDFKVVIAVKNRKEVNTYDLNTFASRYPEQYQTMSLVLDRIIAETNTTQGIIKCGIAGGIDEWVVVCDLAGAASCAVGLTGPLPTGLECGIMLNDIGNPILVINEKQDTNSTGIDWDWCQWFVPPGPYNPELYPVPFPGDSCRWW